MIGVIGDVVDSTYSELEEASLGSDIVEVLAIVAWIVSAQVDIFRGLVDRHNRRRLNASVQVTCVPGCGGKEHFSWYMLGSFIFMIANFFYLGSALSCCPPCLL